MCLAYEREDHIFKGIGYIFLQTLAKRYDRSETKGLGCFLEKLSKGDIDLERREQFSPLLAGVLIKKKKKPLAKCFSNFSLPWKQYSRMII